jgi:hypothetical protein
MYYGDIFIPVLVSFDGFKTEIPIRSMKLFNEGRLIIINGPISRIHIDKLNIVLLSENQDSEIFNPAEQEAIREFVPWSRRVGDYSTNYNGKTVQLVEFIRSNRDKLVLKPTNELGGVGVFVGPKISQEKWEKAMEQALEGTTPWMVQEYAEPLSLVYHIGENECEVHDHVWGLFVFGDRYIDGCLRIMPREGRDGVVNVKQGATVSKIIEVKEPEPQETADDWSDEMQFDFS